VNSGIKKPRHSWWGFFMPEIHQNTAKFFVINRYNDALAITNLE